MLKKSIALRITLTISCVYVLSMAVLLLIQNNMSSSFFMSSFNTYFQEKTQLLAAQMRGGIQWQKETSIARVYAQQTTAESNSNLANVYVTNADLSVLNSYASEHYATLDLAPYVKQAQDSGQDVYIQDSRQHLIVVVPVHDSKKGTVLGYVGMAWSEASGLNHLAEMRTTLIIIALALTIAIIGILTFLLKSLAIAPIQRLKAAMSQLADGDLNTQIPFLNRVDEIGAIAKTLQVFKTKSAENKQMTDAKLAEAAQNAQKQREMERLVHDFDRNASASISTFLKAADTMKGSSAHMHTLLQGVLQQSANTRNASQTTSHNIQAVAAASEELNASTGEIAQQVSRSSDMTRDTVDCVMRADGAANSLAQASAQIGDVVAVINDITGQINLLALNATIDTRDFRSN
jgi:methyl-accepting chemotaxis protein